MDEDFVERRPGDLEMYRRLDAYAETRLAPNAAAMARIRAALMGQAVAMADAGAATLALPLQPATTLPQRPSMTLRRPDVSRWSAAFLAACLCLGLVAGSVAASTAGGPFYGPRLWLEEATLPSAPLPHAHGQLDRLDARLEEIRVATTNANAGAVEAALLAYAEIVDDRPNELIAWRSLPGSQVDHAGVVHFERAPGGRGTQVTVELDYTPPGGMVGATLAKVLGTIPMREVQEDLRRFKQWMETGDIVLSEGVVRGVARRAVGDARRPAPASPRRPSPRGRRPAPGRRRGGARRPEDPTR